MPPPHVSRAGQPAVLAQLQELRNWLYDGELELIDSRAEQLRYRSLSDKQLALLAECARRAQHRKMAKVVSGGGPGSGKRR